MTIKQPMSNKIELPNGKSLQLYAPVFGAYIKENGGFLCKHKACHGLMYYALLARNAYELNVLGHGLQYEGVEDNVTNFKNLIISIAMLYDEEPEKMTNHWDDVDAQFILLGIPQLPKAEQYRFSNVIEIITKH